MKCTPTPAFRYLSIAVPLACVVVFASPQAQAAGDANAPVVGSARGCATATGPDDQRARELAITRAYGDMAWTTGATISGNESLVRDGPFIQADDDYRLSVRGYAVAVVQQPAVVDESFDRANAQICVRLAHR